MQAQGFLKFSLPNQTEWHEGILSSQGPESEQRFWMKPFGGQAMGFSFKESESIQIQPISEPFQPGFESSKSEYVHLVSQAIESCAHGMKKVVCSRTKFVSANPENWKTWLVQLRAKFPKAFVYFAHIPGHGHWIGATPEVLIQKERNQMSTMALAGTKWGDEPFEQKEFDEQQLVTDPILDDLDLGSGHAGLRYERSFGEIRHLCTDIVFDSARPIHEIAEALHPTPAVCGMPKQDARAFLARFEGYDRSLYTGYLLIDGMAESSAAFVNLRCARIFQNGLRFYIGGGINKDSNPENEWEETERKLQVMMNAIQLHD